MIGFLVSSCCLKTSLGSLFGDNYGRYFDLDLSFLVPIISLALEGRFRLTAGYDSYLSSFLKVIIESVMLLRDLEGGDHLAGIFASS